MSEHAVVLRHEQVCDICHRRIQAGEQAYMIRDDFWPSMVWFEHVGGCPTVDGRTGKAPFLAAKPHGVNKDSNKKEDSNGKHQFQCE